MTRNSENDPNFEKRQKAGKALLNEIQKSTNEMWKRNDMCVSAGTSNVQ